MFDVIYIAFIGLGVVVGLFAGLIGVGGGWLLTPTLSLLGFPATQAVGTSLTQMVGTAVLGASRHRKHGGIHARIAVAITIPLIVGVHLGRFGLTELTSAGIADHFIRGAHFLLTIGIGTYMFRETSRAQAEPDGGAARVTWLPQVGPLLRDRDVTIPVYVPILGGLVAGLLSGIMGIGGGLLLVPIMIYVIGMSVVAAVATNLVCIVFGSINGAIGYGLQGEVDLIGAIAIVTGSYVGSLVGVKLAHRSDPRKIRRLFSLLMMMMATAIILQFLGLSATVPYLIFIGAATLSISAIAHAVGRPEP